MDMIGKARETQLECITATEIHYSPPRARGSVTLSSPLQYHVEMGAVLRGASEDAAVAAYLPGRGGTVIKMAVRHGRGPAIALYGWIDTIDYPKCG